MRARDIAALSIMLMPFIASLPTVANDKSNSTVNDEIDTFGKLLTKQVQLFESEIDAKIRTNNSTLKQKESDIGPAQASHLPEAKQEISKYPDLNPILESIWGFDGKDVAEIVYKGRRVPVSMQEPFISRIDGWKLHSISDYGIIVVKIINGKEIERKSISLSWNQVVGAVTNIDGSLQPGFMSHRSAINN